MDRHFRAETFRHERRRIGKQAARLAAERDRGDLFHARERDEDERDQQHDAEAEREGRAPHEVMPFPEGEHGGEPGAGDVGRCCEHQGLTEGRAAHRNDRQRKQQAEQDGERHVLPMVGFDHGAAPGEFQLPRCVEQTPIGADAAFRDFPRLVDRFDDVVVDAERIGARDEIAQHGRLFEAAGNGVLEIVARARPAELGDHDALAGIHLAQTVIGADRFIDRGRARFAFPVGKNVDGDEVDRRNEFGMILPHAPDFTGRDRHLGLALDALDDLDQPR